VADGTPALLIFGAGFYWEFRRISKLSRFQKIDGLRMRLAEIASDNGCYRDLYEYRFCDQLPDRALTSVGWSKRERSLYFLVFVDHADELGLDVIV